MRTHFLVIAGALTLSTAFGALAADAPKGYLPETSLPDSVALLPPPPEAGSAAMQRDEEASKAMAHTPDSPRWQRAASDADLNFPHSAQIFACALGVSPSAERTPTLYNLLQRTRADLGGSTKKAKEHYQRTRPFVAHGDASCTPQDEDGLRKNGSYPSGHTAAGWGWALILAEIDPEHEDAILQRGRAYGESRMVCNVHWQSDIDAGRMIASAAVARLHAHPAFVTDLHKAKAELAAARKGGKDMPESCDAEAESLRN